MGGVLLKNKQLMGYDAQLTGFKLAEGMSRGIAGEFWGCK